jgi:ribose-phosphate pyrophosphokinase
MLTNVLRATAIADKLGIEFALIHRQGQRDDAPERMHILVGDVKDKVCIFYFPT